MERYSFYEYTFEPGISQDDLFQDKQLPFKDLSTDKCQRKFEFLFGGSGVEFKIQKANQQGADKYPCTILAHNEGIVLLRIERPRNVSVYVKQQQTKGVIAQIDKRHLPSNPYNYVIIDCRGGHNMIAISIENDAWRDTDSVANMLRESINYYFDSLKQDIHIVLKPQHINRDFVEYSRFLIKKKKRRVTKMTFYFTGGTINPEIEAIIKRDQYLSGLNNRCFKAKHCEVSYFDPDSASIVRHKSRTLEHFVMLVMSEPNSDKFRLRMTYDDGTTLNCGKKVKFEYDMKDDVFFSIFGNTSMFPEYNIGAWLDQAREIIEEECK